MKLPEPIRLGDIAELLNAKVVGDENMIVTGINEIHKVQEGDLTYVDFDKYYGMALQSDATFILIDKHLQCPENKALLITDDPFTAYNSLTERFRPFKPASGMISDTAEIGEGTVIQPNVFIGNHVKIGKNCRIFPNVVIYDYTEIGDNVIIHGNTTVGNDAFYYKGRTSHYEKMHTVGRAIVESNVEIGANCSISSGVSGDTIIGEGTKIDNLVHIGHGVVVGKSCLMAAQVAIAGKTIIGNNVVLYGKVGINKDLRIGDGAVVLAASNVGHNLEPGKTYFGTPAIEARAMWREMAVLKKITKAWDQISRKCIDE